MRHRRAGTLAPILLLATLVPLASCAVNPATGERQLSLISEQEEIAMGRQADEQFQQMGLVEDPELLEYVKGIGEELAAASERPGLPWTFRILDDEAVNAFALPGGFIYLSRGILNHFNTEAQLAGVLGHEIGHVTGRHSVNQMSRAQLAQLGLGLGSIFAPERDLLLGLAGQATQLLFLKYSRDQESQADRLGYRYMTRERYDPRGLAEVFELLGRVSQASGGDRVPGFLSTHPDPGDRSEQIGALVQRDTADFDRYDVDRGGYLRHIDGLVYGANPREGYFEGSLFLHPELAFRIDFPEGWRTVNQRTAVAAISPEQDAIVVLDLAEESTLEGARRAFAAQEGVRIRASSEAAVNGRSATSVDFTAQTQDGTLGGVATWIFHDGTIYRILGYTAASSASSRAPVFRASIRSFDEVTDPEVLNVQPARIEIVEVPAAMTLAEFDERYPSTIGVESLALLNQLEGAESPLPAGRLLKRVVGGLEN